MSTDEERLLEELQRNEWDPTTIVSLGIRGGDVLALHGLVSLALRHPEIPARVAVLGSQIRAKLELILIELGAITGEQLERIHQVDDQTYKNSATP